MGRVRGPDGEEERCLNLAHLTEASVHVLFRALKDQIAALESSMGEMSRELLGIGSRATYLPTYLPAYLATLGAIVVHSQVNSTFHLGAFPRLPRCARERRDDRCHHRCFPLAPSLWRLC